MSVAWSWAFDTPFKWTKQVASHFGGTRQGMAMAWPDRIKDAGGIRTQFHHMIDIVPTILEAAGIQARACHLVCPLFHARCDCLWVSADVHFWPTADMGCCTANVRCSHIMGTRSRSNRCHSEPPNRSARYA
jgi:hypothetical protein